MAKCKYCSLEPNGDIPADTLDYVYEMLQLAPGLRIKIQVGNAGDGDVGVMVTKTSRGEEEVIREKLLKFKFCPMCGRELKS